MNKKYVIFLLVCLLNAWIWRILGVSPLLGIGLLVLSFLLIRNFKIPALILLAALSTFLLVNTFDTNLKYVSHLERDRLGHRYEYYAESLGRVYRNRIAIYFHYNVSPYATKYLRNYGYIVDPNQYFFAGHPRERGDAVEFEKFSFLLLPFFIIGLGEILLGSFGFLVVYFILSSLISAFAFPGYALGPVLIFPFIVAVIYQGVLRIVKKWL